MDENNNQKRGIPVGAVIGIVVGVILLMAIIFTFIFLLIIKKSADSDIGEIVDVSDTVINTPEDVAMDYFDAFINKNISDAEILFPIGVEAQLTGEGWRDPEPIVDNFDLSSIETTIESTDDYTYYNELYKLSASESSTVTLTGNYAEGGSFTLLVDTLLIDDEWYVINVKDDESAVSTESTEEATEEQTTAEETTESTEVAETTEAAPEAQPQAVSGDLFDMNLSIDGQALTIPFNYSQIKDKFSINLADYGYDEGYTLNDRDSTTSIDTNHNYDSNFSFSVGFANTSGSAKDILDCDVASITAGIEWAETDNYPSIVLPGGITWGSTADDVKAAYGEPTDDPYRAEELGYWVYTYQSPDYDKTVSLTIYDDGGLKEISLKTY